MLQRIKNLSFKISLIVCLFGLFASCEEEAPKEENPFSQGSGSFVFDKYEPLADKPVTVWYHAPEENIKDLPIVFVMHGLGRNGQEYRDSWISLADQYNFLLLTPEFSDEFYPKSRSYNQGNIFDPVGQPNAVENWSFSMIDAIHEYVLKTTRSLADSFYIYGHSAGAQFVHRYAIFRPDSKAKLSITSNAGWYTLPAFDHLFPYGLKAAPVSEAAIKQAFGKKMIIHLGTADTNASDPSLRKTEEANAQGPHRFARGQFFFQTSSSEAQAMNTPFNWELKTVQGVGHSNALMAVDAAPLFFE